MSKLFSTSEKVDQFSGGHLLDIKWNKIKSLAEQSLAFQQQIFSHCPMCLSYLPVYVSLTIRSYVDFFVDSLNNLSILHIISVLV